MKPGIDLHQLYGKARITNLNPKYRVREVMGGEDLRVRKVTLPAYAVGQWEIVDFAEDFTIAFVDANEDFTIRFVAGGEGV